MVEPISTGIAFMAIKAVVAKGGASHLLHATAAKAVAGKTALTKATVTTSTKAVATANSVTTGGGTTAGAAAGSASAVASGTANNNASNGTSNNNASNGAKSHHIVKQAIGASLGLGVGAGQERSGTSSPNYSGGADSISSHYNEPYEYKKGDEVVIKQDKTDYTVKLDKVNKWEDGTWKSHTPALETWLDKDHIVGKKPGT